METILISSIQSFEAPAADKGFIKSIEEHGQKVAVILAKLPEPIREAEDLEPVEYRVVCGRRRIKALQELGTPYVMAEVIEADSNNEAGLVILENLQRSNNPASEAQAFKYFLDAGKTETEIAAMFGVSKSKVSTRLKLLTLIPPLFAKLESGEISARAAWVAADLEEDVQAELAEQETVRIAQVEALRKNQNMATLDLGSLDIPSIAEQIGRVEAPVVKIQETPADPAGKYRTALDHLTEVRGELRGAQRRALDLAVETLESLVMEAELAPLAEVMAEAEAAMEGEVARPRRRLGRKGEAIAA